MVDVRVEHGHDARAGVGRGGQPVVVEVQPFLMTCLKIGQDKVVLGSKVVVQAHLRHSCRGSDGINPGPVHAMVVEALRCCREEAVPRRTARGPTDRTCLPATLSPLLRHASAPRSSVSWTVPSPERCCRIRGRHSYSGSGHQAPDMKGPSLLTEMQDRARLISGEEGELVVHPKGLGPPLDGILRGPPRHLTTQFFVGVLEVVLRIVWISPGGEPSPGSPWRPVRSQSVIVPRNHPTEPLIYIR